MKQKRESFTLIELLVSTTIVGMIALAIFSSFMAGVRVYERIQDYGTKQADVLFFLENIEKDLRNMFNSSVIDFTGDSQQVAFPNTIRVYDDYGVAKLSLGKVFYRFNPQVKAVFKEEQDYPLAILEIGEEKTVSRKLAEVEDVGFSYYHFNSDIKMYDWKDSWPAEEEGIPLGVKVEVTFQEDGKGSVLERTVLIPIEN
jgi:hypothetical protein